MIRVGLLGRADNTGLGVQTLDFFNHMKPSKTLVIDLSHLNGLTSYPERFPGAKVLKYTPYPNVNVSHPVAVQAINEFLVGLDLVFTCETPYDYHLFTEARKRGIRTVLQYNFELLDYLSNPQAPKPDLLMAPSLWRYGDVPYENKVFVPVPVDTERFRFKKRTKAETFLHLAGNPTLEDRNGTRSLLDAWRFVQSRPKPLLLIKSPKRISHYGGNSIRFDTAHINDNLQLYDTGDVFVIPRKYGGLCLPLNEALALGMPVIMTDVSPQNEFLPDHSLIPSTLVKKVFTKTQIDVHQVVRNNLAAKIDELVGNPDLVSELSEESGELARLISWANLLPVYKEVFEAVMDGAVPSDLFSWPNTIGV